MGMAVKGTLVQNKKGRAPVSAHGLLMDQGIN
jgi:hypothetical protein